MKRHQSLYPLSHDHHAALVQARNLLVVAAADDGGNLESAAQRFAGFWQNELQRHFEQEEQLALPLLARHTSADHAAIAETLQQHADIRRLIDELTIALARQEELAASLLTTLGEALRRHIRFEESELFPALETAVPEPELWQLNQALMNDRAQGVCALKA